MAMYAVINAVSSPIESKKYWWVVKCASLLKKLFLNNSKPVAANMVGNASKKENSTIVFRGIPRSRPPIINAPERDTPGINAIACITPSKPASVLLIT